MNDTNPHESSQTPSANSPADSAGPRRTGDEWYWPIWAVVAAFGSYFCMYMFRKPFGAATFEDTTLWGVDFKTVLVTTQVAGYMLSKFLGIKFVSELPPRRRAVGIVVLVLCAEAAMILFGIVPRPWNAICLFLQGLPLGMVFGLVLGGLEGRRQTEALTAGLCASFIFAGGVAKSVGTWLLDLGVSEDWMPAAAGALFIVPICVFSAMLWLLPAPTDRDVAARAARDTMNHTQRRNFLRRYAVGLLPIIIMFTLITIVRNARDDFQPELWAGLGFDASAGTFTQSETIIAIAVLAINALAVAIRDNRAAFFTAIGVCVAGLLLTAAVLTLHGSGRISPFNFMVLLGLGIYVPYVAVHTTVFERLLAMTRDRGTIGYLMYVADSIGYLGYVAVMIARNFVVPKGTEIPGILPTTIAIAWATVAVSLVCMATTWAFFVRKPYTVAEPQIEAA